MDAPHAELSAALAHDARSTERLARSSSDANQSGVNCLRGTSSGLAESSTELAACSAVLSLSADGSVASEAERPASLPLGPSALSSGVGQPGAAQQPGSFAALLAPSGPVAPQLYPGRALGGALEGTVYRLKVVGISDGYSEEQLRQLFSLCGPVLEARIVHDKASGRPVGYGYVSFATKEAADLAISTFDDQLQLQGAPMFLSVYYAKKQHDMAIESRESCPARNAKLYFSGTPVGFRRDSILALFSAFGRVRHLQVYTDNYGVLSSGTVTMYSTEEAIAAMDSLDGKVLQPGTAPLKVTWAQLSTLPRRSPAGRGPPPPMPKGFTVSYACIPTSVTPAEVAAQFERFGMVLQVVPFAHRREGPAHSRGCGLVVMASEQGAADAVEHLSGKVTWPGSERPLLVQPFLGAERAGPHQLPSLPDGGSGGGRRYAQLGDSRSQLSAGGGSGSGCAELCAGEPAPPGCAADAFKLVLANLPSSYTHQDLFALLQPYGHVVSLARYQGSDASLAGTVGVWYASGAEAEAALGALRSTVLMAPEGPRQLVVRPGPRPPAGQQGSAAWALAAGGGLWGRLAGVAGSMYAGHQQQQQQHRGYQQAAAPQQGFGLAQGFGQQAGGMALLTPGPGEPVLPMQALVPGPGNGGGSGGVFDMQQLVYMLPPQPSQAQQTAAVGGMLLGGGGAGVAGMQLSPVAAQWGQPGQGSGMLFQGAMPAQGQGQGLGQAGMGQLGQLGQDLTNSGSMLEQMQAAAAASDAAAAAFMSHASGGAVMASAPQSAPGGAYAGASLGWLC